MRMQCIKKVFHQIKSSLSMWGEYFEKKKQTMNRPEQNVSVGE